MRGIKWKRSNEIRLLKHNILHNKFDEKSKSNILNLKLKTKLSNGAKSTISCWFCFTFNIFGKDKNVPALNWDKCCNLGLCLQLILINCYYIKRQFKNLQCHIAKSIRVASAIKHFTTVIYCHSMVISSFCVMKLGNYCGMAVNYQGIVL